MTHGALFNGVGGFPLAAQWAGIETIWTVEIEDYCNRVSKQHFPNATQYQDIREAKQLPYVDIISGGFPCTDLSIAGSKNHSGLQGERSGLWSEMHRIIDETRPLYVVIENSPELLKKGFEKVLYQLSEIGYDAEWQCLSGTSFGIQQRRERVYCIAYSNNIRLQRGQQEKVFRERIPSEQFSRVHPGWLQRSDIPQPRGFRSTNDLPNLVDRNKAVGNAVQPRLCKYLFELIKTHYRQNK